MKCILFIIYGNRFKILEYLILSLSQYYKIYILFLNDPDQHTCKVLQKHNINYNTIVNSYKTLLLKKWINKLSHNLSIIQILKEKLLSQLLLYTFKEALYFLKNKNVHCIYSHNDRYENEVISYLKAGSYLEIPIIIPCQHPIEIDQYHLNDNHKHLTYSYTDASIYQRITYWFFKKKYSQQICNNYFYYEPCLLNAFYKFKVLPNNPWIIGSSGLTNKVIVINFANKLLLKEYGIPYKKINVFGCLDYDILYKNQQSSLKKKKIVFTLTHLYEHNYMDLATARKEHEFIINSLSQFQDYELVLSLAPMMQREDYLYLEKKYNCTISTQLLNELLPSADLYICSYSTTIFWSVLLNIKTIVLSYYGLNYPLLDNLSSVLYIKNKKNLSHIIKTYLEQRIDFKRDHLYLNKQHLYHGKTINYYITLTQNNLFCNDKKPLPKTDTFFNYIIRKHRERELKRFQLSTKQLDSYKNYYIAPYSLMTQQLKTLLIEQHPEKILGYIDNFKEGIDIKKPNELFLDSQTVIIILSPNHYKTIVQNLLHYCSEEQIVILHKKK